MAGMQAASGTFDFLQDRRRLLAVLLTSLAGTAVLVFLVARGELAGADARAYWGGVRVWLDGGSPMAPPAPYLPYVYAPWSVPIFVPWALLPWDVAWFVWRGVNVLLLLWSASWAYKQHPVATAILLCILAAPIAATLDTGNITLLCALGIWAAQFVGPRLGGGLWALATVLKWFPAPLWLILPARARLWGLIWMGLAGLLSLATWPQTVAQIPGRHRIPATVPTGLPAALLGMRSLGLDAATTPGTCRVATARPRDRRVGSIAVARHPVRGSADACRAGMARCPRPLHAGHRRLGPRRRGPRTGTHRHTTCASRLTHRGNLRGRGQGRTALSCYVHVTGETAVGSRGRIGRRVRLWARSTRQAFAVTASNPAIVRLQLAYLAVFAASSMLVVALSIVAFQAAGPSGVAILTFAQMVPTFFIVPAVAGLESRVPRNRLLASSLVAAAAAAACAAAVLYLSGPVEALYLAAAVLAAATGVLWAVMTSLLPSLARTSEELVGGNVAATAVEGLGGLAGPLAASVLLVVGGPALIASAATLLFLVALVAAAGIHAGSAPFTAAPPRSGDPGRRFFAEATDGLRTLLQLPGPRLVALAVVVQTFVRGALGVLIVVLAFDVLETGDAGVALLTAAIGLGGLLGSGLAAGSRSGAWVRCSPWP